jgi:hypothetical protein
MGQKLMLMAPTTVTVARLLKLAAGEQLTSQSPMMLAS